MCYKNICKQQLQAVQNILVYTVHNPSPNITFCILFWYFNVWSIFFAISVLLYACARVFFIDWRFFTENFNIFVRAHKQTITNVEITPTNEQIFRLNLAVLIYSHFPDKLRADITVMQIFILAKHVNTFAETTNTQVI